MLLLFFLVVGTGLKPLPGVYKDLVEMTVDHNKYKQWASKPLPANCKSAAHILSNAVCVCVCVCVLGVVFCLPVLVCVRVCVCVCVYICVVIGVSKCTMDHASRVISL